jgi:carbamoylphosphate synthase large subunit
MTLAARTVLLGAAGSAAAFAAACSLRRTWGSGVRIITMDIHPRHLVAASTLSDVHVVAPPVSEHGFAAFLRAAIAEHQVSTYVPILPGEVCAGTALAAEDAVDPTVFALLPCRRAADLCADKLRLHHELARRGIPTPRTWSGCETPAADGAPLFRKARFGHGSHGARAVRPGELDAPTGGGNEPEAVIQEHCEGPEVSVDVFRDPHGDGARVLCRERLSVRDGVCVKCRLFEDADLQDLCLHLASALGLGVLSCIQVMRLRGQWVVTDVNPRPGAGTSMGVPTGNDFLAASFAAAWGEPWGGSFRILTRDAHVVRQHAHLLTDG